MLLYKLLVITNFWRMTFLHFSITDVLSIVRRHGCCHVERVYMSKNKALLCLHRKNAIQERMDKQREALILLITRNYIFTVWAF